MKRRHSGRPGRLDTEHAHAPFPGCVSVRIWVSVEFIGAARREMLQTAVADLVPSAWTWTEPDEHVCFDGQTTAFLAPGMTAELERRLDELLASFDPGYAVVWSHEG